ncbi:kinase-like protein [Gigaspora margarita]|uniref:Kinase-like protein n=1 Tax=Gigaspora margarita TaxID=4874 RepID=A0A8H4EQJ6_GIGMA|nr:kinase-like protein [Gigaspora margarita]
MSLKTDKLDYKADNYYMVLQYAGNSDLEYYLNAHFSKLDWPSKIRMAKEISNGIDCLHSANIVHRDLYLPNSCEYKWDKHSDIYSLGVLFWELSSGVALYKAFKNKLTRISMHLIRGNRETPIIRTPVDFKILYDTAWDGDPDNRPDIRKICKKLNDIRLEQVFYYFYEIFQEM